MNIIHTDIKDVLLFEPRLYEDERGWFMESFSERDFNALLTQAGQAPQHFVQDNHSMSMQGVLRGLHYQLPPYEQAKLVRVVQGRAWDVVVDLRQSSDTFGKWVAVELSAVNNKVLWIPAGFAHGFLALENDTNFLYKTTSYYHPPSERILRWNDAELGIDWPTDMLDQIIMHNRDKNAVQLNRLKQLGELFD